MFIQAKNLDNVIILRSEETSMLGLVFCTNNCQVWDANIIQTAEDDFYGDSVVGYVDTLKKNITV